MRRYRRIRKALDEAVIQAIAAEVEKGSSLPHAALLCDRHPRTVANWYAEGRNEEENETLQYQLYREVERARARHQQALMRDIEKAGALDWRAVAFLAERRHAEEFAKKPTVQAPQMSVNVHTGGSDLEAILSRMSGNAQIAPPAQRSLAPGPIVIDVTLEQVEDGVADDS